MNGSANASTQFFSPWDPPPPFVNPPQDSKRAEVIQKLGQFAVKNGASFVELIKVKQKDNPEYQFLFGGEGCDYYRWVLYCGCHGLPADQPIPAAHQQAHPPVHPQQSYIEAQAAAVQDVEGMMQQTLATCDPEVKSGFAQGLAALSGSKVSKTLQKQTLICQHTMFAHSLKMHSLRTGVYQAKSAVVHGMPSICARDGRCCCFACAQPS